MDLPSSYFDKYMASKHSPGFIIVICVVLFLVALVVGSVEFGLIEFFTNQHWRSYFLSPAIISYLILVSPRFSQMDQVIVESLRPLIKLEKEEYNQLVRELLYVNPLKEVLAIIIGVIFAFSTLITSFDFSWIFVYQLIMSSLTYALLSWVIYVNISSFNFIPTLMRQPLEINLFDISPFTSIGRQSLLLSLVFAGGITISMIFVFDAALFQTLQFWLIYIPLGLCPAIIFFSNMIPTHQVISKAKKKELEKVEKPLIKLSRQLLKSVQRGESASELATEINALNVFKKELKNAPTWPYDFSMLRTLFFSILLPGLVIILKSI